ncbi:NUDIX domain-containing protein [Brevibacillus sp. SYSU BS000544]|uniref:NUDIX domain-containing protein n=1 Tax=Brevibacillus sp. SYSU BS000544 TaxID=3416443 RepID=UPI003CE4C594
MTTYRTPEGLSIDICIFTITSENKKSVTKSLPRRELSILLKQRKVPPFKDLWAIPGGFSKEDETLEEAAFRELQEETNSGQEVHIEQLQAYYSPGRNPRGWIPCVVYVALINENLLASQEARDEAAAVRLFPVSQALQMELAFDHNHILADAVRHVQQKMMTTTIAKELLNETFTIGQLYQVIQTVVPEFQEEKPNFIRKMVSTKTRKGLLEEVLDEEGLPLYSDQFSQRKAKLYKFSNYQPHLSIYNSYIY